MNEKYLVVTNRGYTTEKIFYLGDSELQAFKRLKEITYMNKELLLANVKMVTMFNKFELVEIFEVIKKIA
ncbi:hypothetical protein [Clostridium sp. DL1XJH146]